MTQALRRKDFKQDIVRGLEVKLSLAAVNKIPKRKDFFISIRSPQIPEEGIVIKDFMYMKYYYLLSNSHETKNSKTNMKYHMKSEQLKERFKRLKK